jgi:mannose-1-phosphate guanylyltransferase
MMSHFYAVIMAGGSGTRLWPLSRQHQPKQALQLIGERTMLQHAVDRLRPLMPVEQVLIVTTAEYVPLLSSQVPDIPRANFVVEPMARGTAGAIGLAAVHLQQRDPDAVMAVLTADHYIRAEDVFRSALSASCEAACRGHLVTLGIRPTYPATGFGYIRRGDHIATIDGFSVYAVDAFVEKPDAERAVQFCAGDAYSWNSGMFMWRVWRIMDEFARHMPEFYAQLRTIAGAGNAPDADRVLADLWPSIRKETIDYGVMEKADNVVVIPIDIGWSDVGDWDALYDLRSGSQGDTVADGNHFGVETTGCLIRGGKRLIATIGLRDAVIIDTDDVLLVCPRDRAQDVRALVNQLQSQGRTEHL